MLTVSCDKESKVISVDLEVSELICRDGQHILESRLLELDGIKTVTTNIQTREARISYRDNLITADLIKDHLRDFGFTINGVVGNSNARLRLPSCCQNESEL